MGDTPDESNDIFSLIYVEELIPFALGCAIASILFLIVDYAYFMAQGKRKSLLDITYRGNNILFILVTWFGGAFVIGYFATFISIFETSKQSLVALGILWPIAMSKIIASSKAYIGPEDSEPQVEEDEK